MKQRRQHKNRGEKARVIQYKNKRLKHRSQEGNGRRKETRHVHVIETNGLT